ncbi:MAG: lipid biosynthesis B12-binding/radical SAM protein [Candidatus Methylomirabilia bacterium]
MSRVFFVCGNRCVDPYPVYPMGMAVVSAALAARGHEVRQYDLLSSGSDLAALGAAARAYAPDVVCYSLRNVDTEDHLNPDDWLLDGDRAAIQALREACTAPIVLGGAGFSTLPEELLEFLGADYGVVGEGEQVAGDLVDALAAGRPWPRLVRSRELMPAARIGCPLYDAAIVPYYQKTSGLVGLQTKRGCPHACTYCSYPLIEGARVRHRDPREVVDDLETLRRDYGVDNVFFTDSIFNDAGGGHLALAEEMLRRGTNIRWASFFRPQRLERAQLRLLKRAGLYALELGTDAADDATLAALGKGFTFEDVLHSARACAEEELLVAHYVMFGGPGETPETAARGLANLKRLPDAVVFAFVGVRIFPSTRLRLRAIEEGVIGAGDSLLRPTYYVSPGVRQPELEAAIATVFQKRRHWVFPPSDVRVRLSVMRRFGFRGILWDQLLALDPGPAGD